MDIDWLSLGVLMAAAQSVLGSAVVYINIKEDDYGWTSFIPDADPNKQMFTKAAYPHSTSVHFENTDIQNATHYYECRFTLVSAPTRDIAIYVRDTSFKFDPKAKYPCLFEFIRDPEKRATSQDCGENFNIPVGILFETYSTTIDFSKTPADFKGPKRFTVKPNHALWFNIQGDVDVRCNAVPVAYGHRYLKEPPEVPPVLVPHGDPIRPRVNFPIPTTTLVPDNTTSNSSVIVLSPSDKDSRSVAIGVALAVIFVALIIIVTIIIFIVAKRKRDKRENRPQEREPLNDGSIVVEDPAFSKGATTSLRARLTENQRNEEIDKRTSCSSQMPDVICVNGKSPDAKRPATVVGGVVKVAGSPHEYDEANTRYSLSGSSAPSVAGSSTKDKDSHHYFTIDEEYVRNNPNHWAGYPIPPRSTNSPVPAPRIKKQNSQDASKESKYSDSSSNNYEEIPADIARRNKLGLSLNDKGANADVCGNCSMKVDSQLRNKNRAVTPDGYEEPVCCEAYGYARISQIIERGDIPAQNNNKIEMPPDLPNRTTKSPFTKPEVKKKPYISGPTLITPANRKPIKEPVEPPTEPDSKPLFTKSDTANRSNPKSPVASTMPKFGAQKKPRPKSTSTISRPNAKPPAPPVSSSSLASCTIPRPRSKPPEPPKSEGDTPKTQIVTVLKTPL